MSDKMINGLVYQLLTQYDVEVLPNMKMENDYHFKTDQASWLGLFDVDMALTPRTA